MPSDTFFQQSYCDRCRGDLRVRKMSWFNQETICLNCSKWEDKIIEHLSTPKSELEAVGFVPDVPFQVEWTEEPPEDS